MENFRNQHVRDIVNEDYRAADVFRKWNINYCCGGNVTLAEACSRQKIDVNTVISELEQSQQTISLPTNVISRQWPLDFLVDYIVHIHHAYIRRTGEELRAQLAAFVEGHRTEYPHLAEVKEAADELIAELLEHIAAEEEQIFPYIKQISSTFNRKESYGSLFVRTLRKPLHKMNEPEHRRINALLERLRTLTRQYTIDDGVCTNYRVIYKKLSEFDTDLVQHQHLEDEVLIPRAVQMEKALLHL